MDNFNNKIKVESGLLEKPGVKSAAVDLQAATAEVIFDGAVIKCARCICKAIKDMGFEADPKVAAYVIEGRNIIFQIVRCSIWFVFQSHLEI